MFDRLDSDQDDLNLRGSSPYNNVTVELKEAKKLRKLSEIGFKPVGSLAGKKNEQDEASDSGNHTYPAKDASEHNLNYNAKLENSADRLA